jgi:hypothetical protein
MRIFRSLKSKVKSIKYKRNQAQFEERRSFILYTFYFKLLVSAVLLLYLTPSTVTAEYTTYEAINHIGALDKVCGYCVGGMVEKREKGSPTYLYFEYMYGKAIFKVKIWDYDRTKFTEAPEIFYKDKAVCVSGTIDAEMGKPFITVTEPGQMEFMKPYEIQTDEETALEESAKFHKMLFKPKDRVAVKILLKALGYDITVPDDSWEMDAYRAVVAFERDNKLPVNGKMQRIDFFKMEDAIAADKKIPYKKQKEYFNIVEKLLKRQM